MAADCHSVAAGPAGLQRNLLPMRRTGIFVALALAVAGPAGAASQSDNIRLVETFDVGYGNEIDFDGPRVYVGEYGGIDDAINVFEVRGANVTKAAEIPCANHNDVEVLPGKMLAISFQGYGISCSENAPLAVPAAGTQGGVQVVDARSLRRPRYLGNVEIPGGVHTLTPHPDARYVYTSAGGAEQYAAWGGYTHVVDVSDPVAPKIAARYRSPLNPAGCHDIAFEEIRGALYGFCPGQGGTEIWDASDPTAPEPIGRIVLPFGQLPHVVALSSDGNLLAIGDEAYLGHACGQGTPMGAIWIYDVADIADPQLRGFVGPPRGNYPVGAGSGIPESCTAHNFDFVPGTKTLVTAWIGGGTSVLDLTDPAAPEEIAHYKPDDTAAMSSYWYRGLIWVGDFSRGVDVLKLDP